MRPAHPRQAAPSAAVEAAVATMYGLNCNQLYSLRRSHHLLLSLLSPLPPPLLQPTQQHHTNCSVRPTASASPARLLQLQHQRGRCKHCIRCFRLANTPSSATNGTSSRQCTVRVFRQNVTIEDAIGSHACSLEANTRVANSIPLGCSLLLPVDTVNCVQILKGGSEGFAYNQRSAMLDGH